MLYLKYILAIVCLFFINPIFSTDDMSSHHRLEHFLQNAKMLSEQQHFDGEIMVMQKNELLVHYKSPDLAGTKSPQFMIGSMTKQFFAAALLKALYDRTPQGPESSRTEAVLHELHKPIIEFLPETEAIWQGHPPEWAYKITLHHLLSHTSGLTNYTDADGFGYDVEGAEKPFFESPRSAGEILKFVIDKPLEFEPGTKFSYSNTGYLLISEVLRAITGKPADAYLKEVFFDPIGMQNTGNPLQGTWSELKQQAQFSNLVPQWQYDQRNQKELYAPKHSEDISTAQGTGSIISTAEDLLKWNLALHHDHTVLPKPLYELMIKENLDNYGYGLCTSSNGDYAVYSHTGSIGTFCTNMVYLPENGVSIILLSNVTPDLDKTDQAFDEMMEKYKSTIPNPQERGKRIAQLLEMKYSNARGFEPMNRAVDSFISDLLS